MPCAASWRCFCCAGSGWASSNSSAISTLWWPGEFYRAARFDASEIAGFQKDYGIRTIINLRGTGKSDWYKQEVAQSQALGINHLDFQLSASKELTQKEVEALIAMMRDAPKPILVHCRGGADRSGIAAALYLGAITKAGEYAAEWQLSPITAISRCPSRPPGPWTRRGSASSPGWAFPIPEPHMKLRPGKGATPS